MPDLGSDTSFASAYPPEQLYEAWQEHADELDMSLSQFIIRMVEAGRKQINLDSIATESLHELRRRQSELQNELEHQRERNRELERRLQYTTHAEIVEYVETNPGVTTAEIIQRIADTVPGRVASHLDAIEGDVLERKDGGYHLIESGDEQSAPVEDTGESES